MTTSVTPEVTSLATANASGNDTVVEPGQSRCPFQDDDLMFILYAVACSVALVGNVSFLTVVIKLKTMRTIPNFFFINLSVADTIFMMYSMIFLIAQRLSMASFLKFHITIGHSITDVAFCVSMLTVALISLNRYIAICYPFKAESLRLQSTSRVLASTVFIWGIGVSIAIFDALSYKSKVRDKLFLALLILLFICITASIVIVVTTYVLIARKMMKKKPRYAPAGAPTSSRISEEIHVLLLCVGITVVFFVSASPLASVYIVVTLSRVVGNSPIPMGDLFCLSYVAKLMITLHFTLNPILYNIGSKNHRAAFRKVFCTKRKKVRRYSNARDASPMNSCNISMTMSTYADRSAIFNSSPKL
ncbi:somatostatin receptor type 5-like [Ptychodera flava]|uniref:somatostatin receptor type 5-like n=1 Tax=Ptychodera flava TaxID=63121 RepID=UPI00396A9415